MTQNEFTSSKSIERVLKRIHVSEGFTTQEVLQYQRDTALTEDLIQVAPEQPPGARRALLELLTDLGRPRLEPEGELPERLAPIVDDPRIVAYLVRALADNDSDLRNRAATTLVNEVPDLLIRNHSLEIIDSVRSEPTLDGAALLLGKTGAEFARATILAIDEVRAAEPDETRAALARLGDRDAENAVIDAYRRTTDPDEKAETTRRLGYVATLRCVLALARDIRTNESYVWVMESRRSMRVHIIEALHQAFPTVPVFWRPFFKPEDDSYYETIEKWLTDNLGVKWDHPRPEFLYEEDAPAPRPGG